MRGRQRIEPSFSGGAKGGSLRVSREDRPSVRVEDDDDDLQPIKKRSSKPTPRMKKNQRHQRPKSRGILSRLFYWGLVMGVWGAIVLAGVVGYYAMRLPPIQNLAVPKRPPNVAIVAADGELLANRGETGGAEIRLEELPLYVPKAFIAIEDHRYYSHFGLDPIGLGRAVVTNLIAGGVAQGGSTLTQQLAKNLFLTPDRTLGRKAQEAILALWLEQNYSKDQILEIYLNRVYFGAGAYGIEAASQRYFGKSARALTLSEAAMLAGLVKAPSRLAPTRNPDLARERSQVVLNAMEEHGFIKKDEMRIARDHLANAVQAGNSGSIHYVADWVMDALNDHIGQIEQDIRVRTTIDAELQEIAEKALVEELQAKGARLNVSQGAVVLLDGNGSVRALVGGKSYTESQFNRAVAAKRQPGSAFKPFVYLTALQQGLSPSTLRDDSPLSIRGWSPENYTREYKGQVTLASALSQSINTVAVRLAIELGPKNVVRTASAMGIASKMQANPSIALGTSEVTPLELAGAYAPLMNGGIGVLPHVIDRVENKDGELLYARSTISLGRVVKASDASELTAMLEEVIGSGTGRKAFIGRPAAGKTGTTQDFRDGWFAGYTAQYVGVVWVGNDDGSSMKKVTGGGLPAEIWAKMMRQAHQKLPALPLASGREASFAPPAEQDPQELPPSTKTPWDEKAPSGRKGLDSEFLDRLLGR